ncbi:MAG: hypothetical protein PHP03_01845 [Candidatus Pacebacteria bacterium]|nr:hypothetical protein [Candidatus Paceibacterota bacterium]
MIPDFINKKKLYKFTGPPENWVTAIKFMTWGLEEKYRNQWKNIMPGDIFLMHSTSTNTRVEGAISAVIGFGIVGINPTIKNTPLWLEEIEKNINKWPLLVPFSEIYLFSPYFENNIIPEPAKNNISEITAVSLEILKNSRRLSTIKGFPQMGSFSSVKPEVVAQIFSGITKLFVIGQESISSDYIPTPLLKLDDVRDQNRYGTTLQNLDVVKSKTFTAKGSNYSKDPVLLERAERAHQTTLEKLMNIFKEAGYNTYFNKHVDLFATKEDKSFLFEVKSNENKNFLPQVRKGVVQLFEYEYFEIKKFQIENKTKNIIFKNLAFSTQPTNIEYANFMNTLNLGVCYFEKNNLKSIGKQVGTNFL